MTGQSIFAQEWRDCLRAHYLYVIQIQDRLTERTLIEVMLDAGFTEAELTELRLGASLHVDDAGANFVPDAAVVEVIARATDAAPAAATQPQEQSADDADADVPTEPPPSDEYYAPPDDLPRQLSLF
jgi:hypothetical protein